MSGEHDFLLKLKQMIMQLNPKELIDFEAYVSASKSGDKERIYGCWHKILNRNDSFLDTFMDEPYVQRYLKEKAGKGRFVMSEIKIFESKQFGDIRTVIIDDEPWFVAVDVCRALEIGNSSDALSRLDEDERTLVSIEGASNGLPVNAISESGLYSLVLGSRKPEARAFKRWITHDVIPAIRKHGGYIAQPMSPAELSLLQAQALVDIEKKQREQQAAIDTVNTRLDNIGDIISLNPNDWRRESSAMIIRIAQALGGNDFIHTVREEIYTTMRYRFGIYVKTRTTNKKRKALEAGMPKSRAEKISGVDAIGDDKKAIEAYLIVIKEMAIKYGLDKPEQETRKLPAKAGQDVLARQGWTPTMQPVAIS